MSKQLVSRICWGCKLNSHFSSKTALHCFFFFVAPFPLQCLLPQGFTLLFSSIRHQLLSLNAKLLF